MFDDRFEDNEATIGFDPGMVPVVRTPEERRRFRLIARAAQIIILVIVGIILAFAANHPIF